MRLSIEITFVPGIARIIQERYGGDIQAYIKAASETIVKGSLMQADALGILGVREAIAEEAARNYHKNLIMKDKLRGRERFRHPAPETRWIAPRSSIDMNTLRQQVEAAVMTALKKD